MSAVDIVVWEAGGKSAAAIRQLGEGNFTVESCSNYTENCDLAASNPFAICLWEVNLSNWETRARQLIQLVGEQPHVIVTIAASELPDAVIELLQEIGARLVFRDCLEARSLLRMAAHRKAAKGGGSTQWRSIVQKPVDWLSCDSMT